MVGKFMNPDELLTQLCALFPAFEPYWSADNNCFLDADDYTVHGIFASFSHYFLDSFEELEAVALSRLFELVEFLCGHDTDDESLIANAVATCFIENIASTEIGAEARRFMGEESRRFFDLWHLASIESKT